MLVCPRIFNGRTLALSGCVLVLHRLITAGPSPLPVVVDASLRIPPDCKLLTSDACVRPVVLCSETHLNDASSNTARRRAHLESLGATVVPCATLPDSNGCKLDLRSALQSDRLLSRLRERGWMPANGPWRLMVEGGAGVLASFLDDAASHPLDPIATAALVTISPQYLLGEVRLPPSRTVSFSPVQLRDTSVYTVGTDVVIVGRLGEPPAPVPLGLSAASFAAQRWRLRSW